MHLKPGFCGLEGGIICCDNVARFITEGNSSATSFLWLYLSVCIYFVILAATDADKKSLIFKLLY